MKVIARSNTVLIKQEFAETVTKSGLIIPDSAANATNQRQGTIIDIVTLVGEDKTEEHEVNIGDRVLYANNGAVLVEKEENVFLLPYRSLLAKI